MVEDIEVKYFKALLTDSIQTVSRIMDYGTIMIFDEDARMTESMVQDSKHLHRSLENLKEADPVDGIYPDLIKYSSEIIKEMKRYQNEEKEPISILYYGKFIQKVLLLRAEGKPVDLAEIEGNVLDWYGERKEGILRTKKKMAKMFA